MTFKEALYTVLDEVYPKQDGKENVVSKDTIRAVALLWNMLAISKNVLDDAIYIDNINNIHSIPIKEVLEKISGMQKSTSTKKTAAKNSKKQEKVEDDNETTESTATEHN